MSSKMCLFIQMFCLAALLSQQAENLRTQSPLVFRGYSHAFTVYSLSLYEWNRLSDFRMSTKEMNNVCYGT